MLGCCKLIRSEPNRARDLGRLSGPTRASILRLEEARDNEAQFKTFCSTKTIPGRSAVRQPPFWLRRGLGHVKIQQSRASGGQSMNSFEFIDLLRHISVFGKDSSDRHKISKTQAIIAFKNASQAGYACCQAISLLEAFLFHSA
eukprot:631792-Rhodomonas_salina.1